MLWNSFFGKILMTALISMLPVVELRGAIPIATANGLDFRAAIPAAVAGNLLPVPFIILFARKVFAWLRRKSAGWNAFVGRLEAHAESKAAAVRRCAFWGLALFVAIPLPGTGAWTGALIAAMLRMRLKQAFPSIALGVAAAGALVASVTYGAGALLSGGFTNMMTALQAMDWTVLNWIQGTFRCGFLDFLMPKISMLGDIGAVWIAVGLWMLCSKKNRWSGAVLLGGLALCFLIANLCLKPLVARPRPCWLAPDVKLLIPNETDFSFPSGHTTSSFAAAVVLAREKRALAWPAFTLAVLIALSRLYLYVHFPSDVLGGACVGALIGCLALAAGRYVRRRLKERQRETL